MELFFFNLFVGEKKMFIKVLGEARKFLSFTADCCKRVLLSHVFDFDFGGHVGTVFKTLYPKVVENEIEKLRKKDTFPVIHYSF